ncbi:cysteine protease StiP family protein [Vibrio splendidus]|nr:cysteine protease StiP family protein [Vibrio splendidus]MCC4883288.1 cysteine protease StiP family protein [Vibrio splendidus]
MLKPLVGSYPENDCLFLMQEVEIEFQNTESREKEIQKGTTHYSESIHNEDAPTPEYLELFYELMGTYKYRLAKEVMTLAKKIVLERSEFGTDDAPIVLMSLARAGTPIGALLKRALDKLDKHAVHYSISIIRDKGIDDIALNYVRENHADASLVFIDGWTAKGVVTRELHTAVEQYNADNGSSVPKELFVISDIGGTADVTVTFDDYTMPSALLNSTVSGLLSRTILNDEIKQSGGFHGCVVYRHLASCDRTNWFIDEIDSLMSPENICEETVNSKEEKRALTQAFMDTIMTEYGVTNLNRVKPGIAEATRIMLRRKPDLLLVRELGAPDVSHLERIAKEKGIEVRVMPEMPFGACSIVHDI